LAFALLFGLLATAVLGRLLLERRLVIGPTPTITRPPAQTDTPTADFRATINIKEIITQRAYKAALAGINTPTRDVTLTPTATDTAQQASPTRQPTLHVTIFAPSVGNSDNKTATPQPGATPTGSSGTVEIATPTLLPGAATQTAIAGSTATALLFTPTSTPTTAPTATATPTVVGARPVTTLQAVTKASVLLYTGPSVQYAFTQTLPPGITVRLAGRSSSGEWVHVCCVDEVDGWARQAYFNITGNQAPEGSPPDAKGDDVGWLAQQQTDALPLTPQPTATDIPSANYPLFRRDSGATAHVDALFRPPISYGWSPDNLATAGAGFSSPPVVIGSSVIAASLDSQLYSFDKAIGNQRWRVKLDSVVEYAPAVQDPYIYVVDQTGEVVSLRDTGNAADAVVWRKRLDARPSTAMNIRGDTLFASGLDHVLYALDRLNGGRERWRFSAPQGPQLRYPAIGDQMIYVGDARLSALDIYSGTVIWEDSTVSGVAGPPVYARPGAIGLAEVYAVDSAGVIHALDANTGTPFWRKGTADRPTSLAVDRTTIYAAGPGFVSARDRRTSDELWRTPFADVGILGGTIVGNGRLLVAEASGSVQILDAISGQIVGSAPIIETLAGPPAISDGWIFLAARNGRLYGMKESE